MRYYSGQPTDYRGSYEGDLSKISPLWDPKGPEGDAPEDVESNVIDETPEGQAEIDEAQTVREQGRVPETTTEDDGSRQIPGVAPEDATFEGTIEPNIEDREHVDPQVGDEDDEDGEDSEGEVDYDPSQHTVADVLAYIKANPEQEKAVKAAEAKGKNRTSIVDS